MSDKKRVLRAITRLNIGGPARQALMLSKELADEFPTRLVAGHPQPGEGELGDPDVAVTEVPLVRPVSPRHDAAAFRKLRRLLVEWDARLIHTHMAKAGTLGRLAAASLGRRRPRTVHTFHGHVLEAYFGPATQRTFVAIERYLARRTDVLIAISDEIKDQLLELGIGRESQYRVIPLGFDLRPLLAVEAPSGHLRRDLGLEAHVPLVGVLGRLAPIKGHDMLLRAIAQVDGAHLAVLGDGELMATLQDAATGLGIADRVHFAGWRHDIADVISDMDVVALSSKNEGTPVSLIEAHACGRPAVATDVGGVRAVVADGETGILVPSGDVTGMADGLRRLLSDPGMRASYGLAGRERSRRFDKDRLIRSVRDLYRELVG